MHPQECNGDATLSLSRCDARRWWAAAELPTCVSLLQGAWAASLHPAQGTGVLRLQVPTVLSVVAGARTRLATRPSARVHRSAPVYAWGLFVPAVEAASVRARRSSQGRAVWPARSSAARRRWQARAHPRARPQLLGVRAGLTLRPLCIRVCVCVFIIFLPVVPPSLRRCEA